MRLPNFLVMTIVGTAVLTSGSALSIADDAKGSKVSPPELVDSVQHYGGETKRSLRAVEDVDDPEKFKWFSVFKHILSDGLDVLGEKKTLASSYTSDNSKPFDA